MSNKSFIPSFNLWVHINFYVKDTSFLYILKIVTWTFSVVVVPQRLSNPKRTFQRDLINMIWWSMQQQRLVQARKTQIWKYHSRRLPHKNQCFGLWKNCTNIICRYAKVNDFAKILGAWLKNYGLPCPLKFRYIWACKSADFRARDLSFWI